MQFSYKTEFTSVGVISLRTQAVMANSIAVKLFNHKDRRASTESIVDSYSGALARGLTSFFPPRNRASSFSGSARSPKLPTRRRHR